MEAFFQEIKGKATLASAEYDGYVSLVNAYSSEMDGLYKSYQALASIDEFAYRKYNTQVLAAVEENKGLLDGIIEELKTYVGLGNARVKAHAGMAAAALSGLDINARSSTSASYDTSRRTSTSESETDEYLESNSNEVAGSVSEEAVGGGSWNWR
jgi:hypothetical protein